MLPLFLFFSRNGRDGESSEPVANDLQDRWISVFCLLPRVYCKGQKYVSKADEAFAQGGRHIPLKSQGGNTLNWL